MKNTKTTPANRELRRLLKAGKVAKRHKYGVSPKEQRTWDGVTYDSKREMLEAQAIQARLARREIAGWMRQFPFALRADAPGGHGPIVGSHVVDFVIHHLDGTHEVIEVKGHETELWRWKRRHFAAQYPEIKYTVVK